MRTQVNTKTQRQKQKQNNYQSTRQMRTQVNTTTQRQTQKAKQLPKISGKDSMQRGFNHFEMIINPNKEDPR